MHNNLNNTPPSNYERLVRSVCSELDKSDLVDLKPTEARQLAQEVIVATNGHYLPRMRKGLMCERLLEDLIKFKDNHSELKQLLDVGENILAAAEGQ